MPLHLSFRDIHQRYFPDLTNPQQINYGNCFNWALIAKWEYPEAGIELCTVEGHGGHAFIKIGDHYFDSSHPAGSTDWRDLFWWVELGSLYDDDVEIMDEDAFIEHWRANGAYRIWDRDTILRGGEIQRTYRSSTEPEYIHFMPPLLPKVA